jgi:peptidoglycan hydrolase CwlO-like protein
MAEGLKIVVGADVKEAEAALKGFVNTAKSSGEAAGAALGQGLNKAAPIISNIPKQVKPAIKSLSHLGASIEDLEAKLGAKKEFLRVAKTTTDVAFLNDEIRQLEGEIKRVKAIGNPTLTNLLHLYYLALASPEYSGPYSAYLTA